MAATNAGPRRGRGPRTNATATKRGLRWNMALLLARGRGLRTRADGAHVEPVQVLQIGPRHALQLVEDLLLPSCDPAIDETAERVGDRPGLTHRQVVDQRLPDRGDRDPGGGPGRVLGHPDREPLPRVD